jgi:hypothetical protein
MPVRRRWTAAHKAARRLAAAVMLRQWHQTIVEQHYDTPEGHIARLLDAVEAAGLRLHLPGPPRGHTLADRLDQVLGELDVRIAAAEYAAALGPGQADIRTHQRGGDKVGARITQQLAYPGNPDSEPLGPPFIADHLDAARQSELARLYQAQQSITNTIAYALSRLQREISETVKRDTRGVSAGQRAPVDRAG